MIQSTKGLLIKMESIKRQELEKIWRIAKRNGSEVWVDIQQNLIAVSNLPSLRVQNGIVECFETDKPISLAIERFGSNPDDFVELWEFLEKNK